MTEFMVKGWLISELPFCLYFSASTFCPSTGYTEIPLDTFLQKMRSDNAVERQAIWLRSDDNQEEEQYWFGHISIKL